MANVKIPTPLRQLTDNMTSVDVEGTNVIELIDNLDNKFPGVKDKIMEDNIKPLDEHSSCKLSFLKSLLQYFQENKHRTLIFSKYTRVLNAIELMCVRHHFKCARIDGSVKHDERQEVVDAFNHDNKFDCMLLKPISSILEFISLAACFVWLSFGTGPKDQGRPSLSSISTS
mgnify:CR=1 FL=1